jgi:hypothetical protein
MNYKGQKIKAYLTLFLIYFYKYIFRQFMFFMLWICNIYIYDKKNIRLFLWELIIMNILRLYPSFFFLGSTYFWCCIIFSKQVLKTKNQLKLFLKAFKNRLITYLWISDNNHADIHMYPLNATPPQVSQTSPDMQETGNRPLAPSFY